MTFKNGNTYNLNDLYLSYFISNAQLDRAIQNKNLIFSFLSDMKYNINYGHKKSKRYCFIKDLINQYIYIERFLINYPNWEVDWISIPKALCVHLAGVNLRFIFSFHLIQMSL